MKVGIVGEGVSDLAVIQNILKGRLGLSDQHIQLLMPEDLQDETDLSGKTDRSNWELVLKECAQKERINRFLQTCKDDDWLVVHIDTDKVEEPGFGLKRPDKARPTYSAELRALVVQKIESLLGEATPRCRYAVAVEEMEAWVLALREPKKDEDTAKYANPKSRLEKFINDAKWIQGKELRQFWMKDPSAQSDKLSVELRKWKHLEKAMEFNQSLREFVDSLPARPVTDDAVT